MTTTIINGLRLLIQPLNNKNASICEDTKKKIYPSQLGDRLPLGSFRLIYKDVIAFSKKRISTEAEVKSEETQKLIQGLIHTLHGIKSKAGTIKLVGTKMIYF